MTSWGEVRSAYAAVNPETGLRFGSPMQAATVANLIQRWWETRTPSFVDDAVIYCHHSGLPILPELAVEIANAAIQRRGGKTSKAQREGVKDEAFRIMANLILVGASDREAAGKAAVWSKGTLHPMKASSLEKEYPQVWRCGETSLEDMLRADMEQWPEPEWEAEWRALREELPEPGDEERGERR